ncbi:MAG: endonuclease V [Angustibacter sp.]
MFRTVGAVDVHYGDHGGARAALVVCQDLTFSAVTDERVVDIARTAPYEPGALYKRELPCIQALLALGPRLELLVIDGYATLNPKGRPELGAHAARAIGVPVIGIAKTLFRPATHAVEVIRGAAARPLYVTTAGELTAADAAKIVAEMAGPHRIPTALARVDNLSRGRVLPINTPLENKPSLTAPAALDPNLTD